MKKLCCCLTFVAMAGVAQAQDKAAPPGTPPPAGAAAGMPDMSKMGPMSRPVTKEDKKGVEELIKACDEAWKTGNMAAMLERIDFPVVMMSDDSKGAVQSFAATRDQWAEMMKPMMTGMPKEMKHKAKRDIHFLSDTMALVVEDVKMEMGKTKGKWKGFSVVNKKEDGKWRIKQMAEAGWGDSKPPGAPTAAAPKR
jgi:hypothetical protein